MGNLFVLAFLAAGAAVVTRPVANMHSAPSEDTDVVSQAILSTNVQILEEKDQAGRRTLRRRVVPVAGGRGCCGSSVMLHKLYGNDFARTFQKFF